MAETKNLMDGLLQEMNRVREIKRMYDEIPEGRFRSIMIQHAINEAEKSISSGDVVQMLTSYQELKEIE